MSLAPSPCTRPPSMRPGRLSWAGTVSRCPASRTGASSGPARTHVSPRSRASTPPSRRTFRTCPASRASSRDSDGMSTSSSVRAARRSARTVTAAHNSLVGVRYCGVDVSAKPGNQQLVTLHERRAAEGGVELVATFYEPGTPEAVARTIEGFGRGEAVVAVDAPVGPAARPARTRVARCARGLGLPEGRYERMRVCDALLFRRGLPLYPVPPAGQAPQGWEQWIARRLRAVRRAGAARPLPPGRAGRHRHGRRRRRGAALRPPVRDLSRRRVLLPARASPAAEAHAVGPAAADRRAAHAGRARRRRRAVAPHARRARRLRRGLRRLRARHGRRAVGGRAGGGRDRAPVRELRDRYEKLPPPARALLAEPPVRGPVGAG